MHMIIHNLDPIFFEIGFISIRWYSLAYIFGIFIGWWYGKKIIQKKIDDKRKQYYLTEFDNLITYIIISIIIGGRMGYVIFYNLPYYINNPWIFLKFGKGVWLSMELLSEL